MPSGGTKRDLLQAVVQGIKIHVSGLEIGVEVTVLLLLLLFLLGALLPFLLLLLLLLAPISRKDHARSESVLNERDKIGVEIGDGNAELRMEFGIDDWESSQTDNAKAEGDGGRDCGVFVFVFVFDFVFCGEEIA